MAGFPAASSGQAATEGLAGEEDTFAIVSFWRIQGPARHQ
jgi:hypothetical protein